MHKSLKEMVQELVQKSNLSNAKINDLVKMDDVTTLDIEAVLNQAMELVEQKNLPKGEAQRAEILVNSIHAAKLIIHPQVVSESRETRVERHHGHMSNGLNSVAHLDRDALNTIDTKE